MKIKIIFLLLLFLISCSESKKEYRNDLSYVFDSSGYKGCMVVLNVTSGKKTYINYDNCIKQYSPAQTFQIPASLIALETKSVKSIHDTIRYNGIIKPVEDWNRDHDLESAFKYSVDWYFQDISNRIGDSSMKFWLDTLKDYGTMIKAGRIDDFWIDGSLVISADEQVNFLKKLYEGLLPFSSNNIDTVKNMMIIEKTPKYSISGIKGITASDNVGWFIGWVEKGKNSFIFAANITSQDTLNTKFLSAPVAITKKLLNKLQVLD